MKNINDLQQSQSEKILAENKKDKRAMFLVCVAAILGVILIIGGLGKVNKNPLVPEDKLELLQPNVANAQTSQPTTTSPTTTTPTSPGSSTFGTTPSTLPTGPSTFSNTNSKLNNTNPSPTPNTGTTQPLVPGQMPLNNTQPVPYNPTLGPEPTDPDQRRLWQLEQQRLYMEQQRMQQQNLQPWPTTQPQPGTTNPTSP